MLKKLILPVIVATLLWACDGGTKKSGSSPEYKIHKDEPGETIKSGDLIEVHIAYKNDKDTVISDTRLFNRPQSGIFREPKTEYSVHHVFTFLSEGDSATVKILADSVYLKSPQGRLPAGVDSGSYVTADIVILKVVTEKSIKAKQQSVLEKAKKNGFKVTYTGIPYKIHTAQSGEPVRFGDSLTVHFDMRGNSDSVITDTRSRGEAPKFIATPPAFEGSLEEIWTKLRVGDSVSILLDTYLYTQKQQGWRSPPGVEIGDFLTYNFKVINIVPKDKFLGEVIKSVNEKQQEAVEAGKDKLKEEEQTILDYIKENDLKAKKTASGLYYIIEKEGSGNAPKPGDFVKVHYTGTLLDGSKFDSSLDREEPFTFQLGLGNVIQGWDKGIALLKPGTKATLLIPSVMAYGAAERPGIPANSILKFEVELLDIY